MPGSDMLNEFERFWKKEIQEWAKIFEKLDDETLQEIAGKMMKQESTLFGEAVANSPKLKKRLLWIMA